MQKIKKNTRGIQDRIILTISLLILSRFGTFVPVPGVDHDAVYQITQ
jgi:preprotein translocase subunit SecY